MTVPYVPCCLAAFCFCVVILLILVDSRDDFIDVLHRSWVDGAIQRPWFPDIGKSFPDIGNSVDLQISIDFNPGMDAYC